MINRNIQKKISFLLAFSFIILLSEKIYAQAQVRISVTRLAVTQNSDCDGFLTGDSDFQFNFKATDPIEGYGNNNPDLLTDRNSYEESGNNGPWTNTTVRTFWDHTFACQVPSTITLTWEGFEDDGVTTEGNTGLQNVNMTVPAVGGVNTQQFTASSTGCNQTYQITFRIETLSFNVTQLPDAICSAVQHPVNAADVAYAWCGNATFEPTEPYSTGDDIANHGSRWIYFIAPTSGGVDISTDIGPTEFGTEVYIYHAADGVGCSAGLAVNGTRIKNKFRYLSFLANADLGGLLNLEGEADLEMSSCSQTNVDIGLSSPRLIAGQAYYIQISTDDNNPSGVIGVNISDVGGSQADRTDIPCTSNTIAVTQTPQTNATTPATFSIGSNCSFDSEVQTAQSPVDAAAYPLAAPGGENLTESVWFNFRAPCSGAIYFEANNAFQGETNYLLSFDTRFAPGRPGDLNCADLVLPNNDYTRYFADGGALGGSTAIIRATCLEPGYTYFGMVDAPTIALGDPDVWLYDPGSSAPGNDIMCLALGNPTFNVPVQLLGQPATSSVSGSTTNACFEYLAGEPRIGNGMQSTWHYFTAPPSGVVDITVNAGTIGRVSYAVYNTLDGTTNGCYGGLYQATTRCPQPNGVVGSTFTTGGVRTDPQITSLGQGNATATPSTIQVCCLVPGNVYAIQIDGTLAGDIGTYNIQNIREVQVRAGTTSYSDPDGEVFNAGSVPPNVGLVCAGESITASSVGSILPSGGCLAEGFILHNTQTPNLPYSTITVYQSRPPGQAPVFTNNGVGGYPYNTVIYVSSLVDEATDWGNYCPSARIQDAAPLIFLRPITFGVPVINDCDVSITVSGGLPSYNSTNFTFAITGPPGSPALSGGIVANNGTISFTAPRTGVYTILVTDNEGCTQSTTVNVTAICDPCQFYQPIGILPNPINNTIYSCNPLTQGATATVTLTGGRPQSVGTGNYIITLSGTGVTAGTFNSTGNTFTFNVANNASWTISVTDADNCSPATATGTFVFDQQHCPDLCTSSPLTAGNISYTCNTNGTVLVTITLGGGLPALDGNSTPYIVTLSGSSNSPNGTFNIVGNAYSFTINNNDAWTVSVTDRLGCTPAIISDIYQEGIDPCNNCNSQPDITSTQIYNCNGNGTAEVVIAFSGGFGAPFSGNYVVNGVSTPFANNNGSLTFTVGDNQAWTVNVVDRTNCQSDQLSGTFDEGTSPCANCNSQPDITSTQIYNCNGNGTAEVVIAFSGGFGAPFSGNYVVNGVSTPFANNNGSLTFTVGDNQAWTVNVVDRTNCQSDQLIGTFDEGTSPCANCNSQPDITSTQIYNCNGNGTAEVVITFSGGFGAPFSGNYVVNGVSTPFANNNGSLTFTVGDNQAWTVNVVDRTNCQSDQLSGTFDEGTSPCANCNSQPDITSTQIYNCNGNGTAEVVIAFSGGFGAPFSGNYVVNGVSTPFANNNGSLTFTVGDNQAWTVNVVDRTNCQSDQLSGTFDEGTSPCANCNSQPDITSTQIYNCNGNGTAEVVIAFSGGFGAPFSGNYVVNGVSTPFANNNGSLTFTVGDNQAWTVNVVDRTNCQSDQLSGTFDEGTSPCANCNSQPDITSTQIYNCNGNGTAEVVITFSGGFGAPFSGNYVVNGVSTPFANNNGSLTFTVGDNQAWTVNVVDRTNCQSDQLSGTFDEGTSPCANCNSQPDITSTQIYNCNGNGTAEVVIAFSGGFGAPFSGNYVVNGVSTPFANNNGSLTFTVGDNQAWTVNVVDRTNCQSDQLSGTFDEGTSPCANCNSQPDITSTQIYNCNGNGTAEVVIAFSGGFGAPFSGNYVVNGVNTPFANNNGSLTFTVGDNQAWTVNVVDRTNCQSDQLSGTFDEGTSPCANCNSQPDITSTQIYNCNGNGTAEVVITFSGGFGAPFSGNYVVNGVNTPFANNNGSLTFTVGDNQAWTVNVVDRTNCQSDQLSGTFDEGTSPCANCNSQPDITSTQIYNCNGNGTAEVVIAFSGGFGAPFSGNYVVNGVSTPFANNNGSLTFTVGDNQAWTVNVVDRTNCQSDQLSGTFDEGTSPCANCNSQPAIVANYSYACNGLGSAVVTIQVTGGFGGEYSILLNNNGTVSSVITSSNTYSFVINNNQQWSATVRDRLGCNGGSISDIFVQNPNDDCAQTCGQLNPIRINGSNGFEYICNRDGSATVNFSITGGLPQFDNGATPYLITYTNNGLAVQATSAGSYSITIQNGDTWGILVTDNLGCTSDNIGGSTGVSYVLPNANAGSDQTIYIGQSVQLNGSGGTNYSWSPITALSATDIYNPIASPTRTITYVMTTWENGGCPTTDSITVIVKDKVDCFDGSYTITPNGDGINDVLTIDCLQYFNNTLTVFNRWGQKVFEQDNYSNQFNGTSGGKDLPDGTYYFTIEIKTATDVRNFRGAVVIIR